MGQSNVNLAALIGSRICHDLISPIGAINNGLELLGMAGGSTGPEMDLISESVENASARIRFFRMAYGAAGDQPIGRAEVVSILKDNTRGARMTIAYGPLDEQPRWAVRLGFLGIQCLETAMPYGGRIELSVSGGQWMLIGYSEKILYDSALWGVLDGNEAQNIAPSQVQFPLLYALSQDVQRTPSVALVPGQSLTLRF